METPRDPREMICTSIKAKTLEEMASKTVGAESNIIELRLDTLKPSIKSNMGLKQLRDLVLAARQNGRRIILTYRGQGDSATGRLRLLNLMVKAEPDYIDLDIHSDPIGEVTSWVEGTGIMIIGSHHDYNQTPSLPDLTAVVDKARGVGASIIKVVTTARRIDDNLVNLRLTSMMPSKIISFSMGPLGTPSRILAPFFGAPFTYASYTRGEETAPGQIEAGEVIRIWRMMRLV
ncbi:MAG: type I 3-dehydroquinate dehydratase [Desulfurococcales archaeon]|nr:type I 3-dehydroquinate dehydratase [Desulfurococcales archaeon]